MRPSRHPVGGDAADGRLLHHPRAPDLEGRSGPPRADPAPLIRHSIAEERRDLDGLIATLAPDCAYEIEATGQRWEGHAGARRFYTEFLGAIPDVHFDLVDIVIGPQGVIEVATMTGTHRGPWAGITPSGRPVRLTVVIHFPWDPAVGLFAGERIYLDRAAFGAG